jgi:DHA2 family multidrug resistance protein
MAVANPAVERPFVSNGAPAHAPLRNVIEYGSRRTLITIAIVTATLLEIIDVTIVNVALPNIQGNFGATVDQAAWIGTGYIIANVVVIPLTPWLQRRFGRRQYYAASIGIFTLASIMCGTSGTLEELVFWRIIQGIGGGGLISTSQAILRETYPQNKQGMAAGLFAMGVIVGPTIGPTVGGFITDQWSWRWAFFVNVPLGILAAMIVLTMLRNPERPTKMPLDAVGLGLLAIGIGSLQYVLDQGQQKDWFDDGSIMACAIIAGLGLIGFVVWDLRQKRPLVDLSVLRYRSVAAGSILGVVLGISLYGSVLIIPQYVQGSLGFTATDSGELLVFRAAAVMLFTPLAAFLSGRGLVDPRWQVAIGFVLIGISNFMLASVTTTGSDFWTFMWPLALSGVGLAQIFVPLTVTVLGSVPMRQVPGASAFFNLARQMGGSIAIAVLVTILARSSAIHHTELASHMTLSQAPVAQFIQRNGGFETQAIAIQLNGLVNAQASVMAYADTARFVAIVSLVLAPLAFILKRPPKNAPPVPAE